MPFQCEKCEKVFKQKSHFESHQKSKRPCKKKENSLEVRLKILEEDNKILKEQVKYLLSFHPIQQPFVEIIPPPQIEVIPTISPSLSPIKPFLKWVGGKTQIIDDVLSLFPQTINNYHEPFLGGGSVLLAVLSYKKASKIQINGSIYASDLNANLINLYTTIQKKSPLLIRTINEISKQYALAKGTVVNRSPTSLEEAYSAPESYYYWIRNNFNAMTKEQRLSIKGAAMILFMNKTCFRGVYREGPKGFNVPYGNYNHPAIIDESHIMEISELIKDVKFSCSSFNDAMDKVTMDDFIYLDPPYAPENSKSFVGYTTDGFDIDQHKMLFAKTKELKAKNVKMVMSNAAVDLVKDSFPAPDYVTKVISCKRHINSKKPDAKANEVLITN
jgi:DNA adenine methylase